MQDQKLILCPECGNTNKIKENTCKDCNSNLILNEKYHLLKILGQNTSTTYKAQTIKGYGQLPVAAPVPPSQNQKSSLSQEANIEGYGQAHRPAPATFYIIKELSLRTLDKWKTEELFKREISTLSKLNHPSIPNFIENFSSGKGKSTRTYLVMEFFEGENLEEERKSKTYTNTEVLEIMKSIAKTLKYLHHFHPPIIHRDLKPSNLIRKKDGSIGIIDFGSVIDIIQLNGGSTVAGTLGYMAPEQILGIATKSCDYYSLAVIGISLISEKKPEEILKKRKLKWKPYIKSNEKLKSFFNSLLKEKADKRLNDIDKVLLMIDYLLKVEETYKQNLKTINPIKKMKSIKRKNYLKHKENFDIYNVDEFLGKKAQSNLATKASLVGLSIFALLSLIIFIIAIVITAIG